MTRHCRICGAVVPKGRIRYCSETCLREARRQANARRYEDMRSDPEKWDENLRYWRKRWRERH